MKRLTKDELAAIFSKEIGVKVMPVQKMQTPTVNMDMKYNRIPIYIISEEGDDAFSLVSKHWFDKNNCVHDDSFISGCVQMDDFVDKNHYDIVVHHIGKLSALIPQSIGYSLDEIAESYFNLYDKYHHIVYFNNRPNDYQLVKNLINNNSQYFEVVDIIDNDDFQSSTPFDNNHMDPKYDMENNYWPDWYEDGY